MYTIILRDIPIAAEQDFLFRQMLVRSVANASADAPFEHDIDVDICQAEPGAQAHIRAYVIPGQNTGSMKPFEAVSVFLTGWFPAAKVRAMLLHVNLTLDTPDPE